MCTISEQEYLSNKCLCDHERYLAIKDYNSNKQMFNRQFRFQPTNLKTTDMSVLEFDYMQFQQREQNCTKYQDVKNNINKYMIYDIVPSKGFLLQPCKQNTYVNGLVCDDAKCCSRTHQVFNNLTKQHPTISPSQ